MKKTAKILLLFLLTASGCEEITEWETQDIPVFDMVVDGMLTNQPGPHLVRLNKPVSSLNQDPLPLSGALVAITDGTEVAMLNESPPGSGLYYTDPQVRAVINKNYILYIEANGKTYHAVASMIPISPLSPPAFVSHPDGSGLLTIRINEGGEPNMTVLELDWSHLEGYQLLPSSETSARLVYYELNIIDPGSTFAPDKESVWFPAGTRIVRKKYSLSPDHVVFLRSLLKETEWRGGVFDALPANVRTNLKGGAAGFFAVSTMLSDTLTAVPSPE